VWRSLVLVATCAQAQDRRPAPPRRALPELTQEFISVDAPVVVLQHVRVIDGTGAAPVEDQTVVIENGRISAIGSSRRLLPSQSAGLHGSTVIPGLVGMHEHMFYPGATGVGRIPGAPECIRRCLQLSTALSRAE